MPAFLGPNSPTPTVADYNRPVAGPEPIRPPLSAAELAANLSIWEALTCRKFDLSPKQFLQLLAANTSLGTGLTAEEAVFCQQWRLSTGLLAKAKAMVKVTDADREMAAVLGQPPTYAISAKARLLAREVVEHIGSRDWRSKQAVGGGK